jgi:hypothetical protein
VDGQARLRAQARALRPEPGGVPAPRERPARQELVGPGHRPTRRCWPRSSPTTPSSARRCG